MVAKTAPAWKAARQRMISTPLRAPAVPAPRIDRRAPRDARGYGV